MSMSAEVGILLAYAFGILLLYVVGYLFLVPIKFLLRLVINSVLGGVAILAINWIGAFFDFHIAFNWISAAMVGILGIPGLLLWLLLSWIL